MERVFTGKTRLRALNRLFRKPLLILQVQLKETGTYTVNAGASIDVEPYSTVYWRDAVVEDNISLHGWQATNEA